jgi:hypothetical protein
LAALWSVLYSAMMNFRFGTEVASEVNVVFQSAG